MSENYSPDPGVSPVSPYDTVFLSQRDLGLQVPINYITVPGVSFTAACFPQLIFEDQNSGYCLSNLLAVGFRKFQIDLYWDQGRKVWSFCPVSIPTTFPSTLLATTVTLSVPSTTLLTQTSAATASSSSGVTAGQARSPVVSGSSTESLNGRSASSPISSLLTSVTGSTISDSSTTTPTSLGETVSVTSALPDSANGPLLSIGPYVCSSTINLSTFLSQLLDYVEKTETTLDAHLLYVIINVHAAAADSAPLSPAPSPASANLPQPSNLVGALLSGNLSAYLYTPVNLRSDRANINGSWYTVSETYRPVEDYYVTETDDNGIVSTQDGWPSEFYIEFHKSKRLLLGWGSVDPQMSGYNFTGDEPTIFPSGYIQDIQMNVNATSSGQLTTGCFLSNSTDVLSRINSSWAADTTIPGFEYPTSTISNITSLLNLTADSTNCGISPILNVTLLNSTAHENYIPYQNYSYSTIWSWAPGEPKNYTGSLFRCATSNIDLSGRWAVNDCSQKYYAACRAINQPYNWTITTYPISYSFASQACPDRYGFAAPRTALENSYLTQAIRDSHRDYDGHGPWVDFNNLDVDGCWVSGGPNATCPYTNNNLEQDNLRKKTVLVPSLAALIVLVITALTLFVKMAGNRKVRKRSRNRSENGVLYEGIPS